MPHRRTQPVHEVGDTGQGLPHVGAQVGHAGGAARRVEHWLPPRQRMTAEHRQRGVADAATRHVHHAEEGLIVGRVGDEPQIGQQILDLAALIKAHRADQAVRNTTEAKGFFQRP